MAKLRERYEKLTHGRAGSAAQLRAEREYLAVREVVEARVREEVGASTVDAERADKAQYMREYRAQKAAQRAAVDASRGSHPS